MQTLNNPVVGGLAFLAAVLFGCSSDENLMPDRPLPFPGSGGGGSGSGGGGGTGGWKGLVTFGAGLAGALTGRFAGAAIFTNKAQAGTGGPNEKEVAELEGVIRENLTTNQDTDFRVFGGVRGNVMGVGVNGGQGFRFGSNLAWHQKPFDFVLGEMPNVGLQLDGGLSFEVGGIVGSTATNYNISLGFGSATFTFDYQTSQFIGASFGLGVGSLSVPFGWSTTVTRGWERSILGAIP